ncbi:hypothetical protein EVA_15471, partial [gut metagenome]
MTASAQQRRTPGQRLEGVYQSLRELSALFAGPLQRGAGAFAGLERKIITAMRAVTAATKNQIAGFDELHRAEAALPGPGPLTADKQPSGAGTGKAALKALRQASALLRQLTAEVIPAFFEGLVRLMPGLDLLAAGLLAAFHPLDGLLKNALW